MTRRILLLDQFSGITPYSLQQNPEQFDDLVRRVMSPAEAQSWTAFTRPLLIDRADDDFYLPMGTTAIEADANGRAQVWRTHWDSSG